MAKNNSAIVVNVPQGDVTTRHMELASPVGGEVAHGINLQSDGAGLGTAFKVLNGAKIAAAIKAAIARQQAANAALAAAEKAWNDLDAADGELFPVPAGFRAKAAALEAAVKAFDPKAEVAVRAAGRDRLARQYTVTATATNDRAGSALNFWESAPLTPAVAAFADAVAAALGEASAAGARLAELRDAKAQLNDKAEQISAAALVDAMSGSAQGQRYLKLIADFDAAESARLGLPDAGPVLPALAAAASAPPHPPATAE